MSTFSEVATIIKGAFDTEFAPEGLTLSLDCINEALGYDRMHAGISPTTEIPGPDNYEVKETYVEVQFFGKWNKQVNPDQRVDPTAITDYAERFRKAMRGLLGQGGTGNLWFFDIHAIEYPRDPTGNKTRFVATICAYGNNTHIIETV